MIMDQEEATRLAMKVLEEVTPEARAEFDAILKNIHELLNQSLLAGLVEGNSVTTSAVSFTLMFMAMGIRDPKWGAKLATIAELMPSFGERESVYREWIDRRP